MTGNFSPWSWDDDPLRHHKGRNPGGNGANGSPWSGHAPSMHGSPPLTSINMHAATPADLREQLGALLASRLDPIPLADAQIASLSETEPESAEKALTELAESDWYRQGDRALALALVKKTFRLAKASAARLNRKYAAAATRLAKTPRRLTTSVLLRADEKYDTRRRLVVSGWYTLVGAFLGNEFIYAANLGKASLLGFLSTWPAAASFAAAFVLPASLWLKVEYGHRDQSQRAALRKRLFPFAIAASVLGGCCYAWILSGRAAGGVMGFAAGAQPTLAIQILSALAFLLQITAVTAVVVLATDAKDKFAVNVETPNEQFPDAEREEREIFTEWTQWDGLTALAEELNRRLVQDRASCVAATIAAHRAIHNEEDARDDVADEGDNLRRAKRRLRRRKSN